MKALLCLLFLTSCSHLFYQPTNQQYFSPPQFKLAYQERTFKSGDGTKLHSWFLPAASAPVKGTIILFHGNAQNLSSHFLNLAWTIKQGFNLFIFDYRGYGLSHGRPSQKGLNMDALAALAEAQRLNTENGNGKFIVFGQSFGGVVSMRALSEYPDLDKVDLVVQDSTFSSYIEIAWEKLTDHWLLYALSPLAFLAVSDDYSSHRQLPAMTRPTLVIVGEKDFVIPAKLGRNIYQKIGSEQKWIWELQQGRHIDVFHGPNEIYREKFAALIESLSRE